MTKTAGRLGQLLARPQLPGDVALAVALSVVTRIEPELVRAVRLHVLPRLDVGAEADFWFSEWVGRRQPDLVMLDEGLLPMLRGRLAEDWRAAPPDAPLRRLREIVTARHPSLPPVFRVEEDATWEALLGDLAKAAELLYRPLVSMDTGNNDRLADWVVEARRRLPENLLCTDEAWHLTLVAKAKREREAIEEPDALDLAATGRVEKVLGPAASHYREHWIGVRWDGDELVLGEVPAEAGLRIKVRGISPLLLRVTTDDGQDRWYDVGGGKRVRPRRGAVVRVRTAEGTCFLVPQEKARTVGAAKILTLVPVADRRAECWLQQVTYDGRRAVASGQPSMMLAEALRAVTSYPEIVSEVARRIDAGPAAVLLLTGADEVTRVQLADDYAATCERAGWTVLRARQDPGTTLTLGDEVPGRTGRGALVVVDRAEYWHPHHLALLVVNLRHSGFAKLRVLLLARREDAWWRECRAQWRQEDIRADRYGIPPEIITALPPAEALDRCLEAVLPGGTPAPRVPPGVEQLPAGDIPAVAVAMALEPRRGTLPEPDEAMVTLLDREAEYRAGAGRDTVLSRLCFLTALIGPCKHQTAQSFALDQGLIDTRADWVDLSERYLTCYPSEPGFLTRPGPEPLADAQVLHALTGDRQTVGGVDAAWAGRLVRSFSEAGDRADEPREQALTNGLLVLARLAHASFGFYQDCLRPLLAEDPGFACRHGGPGLGAVVELAATGRVRRELLERIRQALPPDPTRDVSLDQSVYRLEQLLERDVAVPPGPERRLRLGEAAYRAGYLSAAAEAVLQAVTEFRTRHAADPAKHVAGFCRALITASRIQGERGAAGQALELAEEAERWSSRVREVGVNQGAALANLAARKLAETGTRGGPAPETARSAVRYLQMLVDDDPSYRADLAAALPILSDVLGKSGAFEKGLGAAEAAVGLCAELGAVNPWAHRHLLATAQKCRSARLAELARFAEALEDAERAVELFDQVAQASPSRFRPALAEARLWHAELLETVGAPEADRVTAAEAAVAVFRTLTEGTADATEQQRRRAQALGVTW